MAADYGGNGVAYVPIPCYGILTTTGGAVPRGRIGIFAG